MKIDNWNYSITFAILSAIVIGLTPLAIHSDHDISGYNAIRYNAITPIILIGDCLMVSMIYLTRKGSGLSEIQKNGDVK